MSTVRATRLSSRDSDRILALEQAQRSNDDRLEAIENMLKPIYNVFMAAKGIRWLLYVVAGFVGLTATTVTATIGAIRFFTGH